MDSKLLNVTGLWISEGKDGSTYLSGPMGSVRILIFKNKKKSSDKHPDYYLCFGQNESREKEKKDSEELPF